MNVVEPTPTSRSSGTLIWPVSAFHWRYVTSTAPWLMALFLFGIFVDFGGGFYIKLALTLVALGWVVTRRITRAIWARCRWDLVVLLGIPVILGAPHVLIDPETGYLTGLSNLYSTISSALLLLLLPLVYLTGAGRAQRMVLIGMGGVAIVMLLVAALHVIRVIDLSYWTEWAQAYRVGFIGLDPRQPGVPPNLRPVVGPRVAYTLVLGFGLALAVSWPWAGLMAVALIILNARGMWLGALFALGLWWATRVFLGRFKIRRRSLLFATAAIVGLTALALGTGLGALLVNNVQVIATRFVEQVGAQDLSTQVRLGHLSGYWEKVEASPVGALVGFGPGARLYNAALGVEIEMAEISALNIALWYGVPYLILYLAWLFGAAWQLWRLRHRPGYTGADTALAIGSVALWLAGNTNPLLTSPISMIALMLIRVRILELVGYRPRAGVRSWRV